MSDTSNNHTTQDQSGERTRPCHYFASPYIGRFTEVELLIYNTTYLNFESHPRPIVDDNSDLCADAQFNDLNNKIGTKLALK